MIAAGGLRLVVRWQGDATVGARIENSRPLAARLLVGRQPAEAIGMASALFSLCGRAQGVATRRALLAAAGDECAADPVGEHSIAIEAAQEHLWRVLLDWPQLLARAPQRERFASLHRRLAGPAEPALLAAEIDALVDEAGLAASADSLAAVINAAQSAGELGQVLAAAIASDSALDASQAATPLMPLRSAAEWGQSLQGRLPDAAFCSRPSLLGNPVHTGALARQARQPAVAVLRASGRLVAARLAARLAELSALAQRLRGAPPAWPLADAAPLGPACGLARVESARGLLMHAVRLEHGRVADYAIVAPTEWNFHPAGVFVREVSGWPIADRDAVVARARRLALSLDPCVAWDVVLEEVRDA